ncbi:DNA-binding transcriptional regulator, Lrp family [Halapricum desulfuricans]|uniref:DNA-binding transcriptional regulator, Lrp family n=1 Tax=Halapricum desulfuricans TaxID=2841257 RepID=A0A897NLP8_9EURY|nr:Lrp/AsnC family transcriptional regulator [Halapricum desulfuricans]QSG11146.1 DNA-binding transcriptional regulator, Lrp family [Halapricum desulfuricans]
MTPTDTDEPLSDDDRAVLDARIRDAQADAETIAVETGIAADRVEAKLDRFEDAGVIDGYTARLDYGALGYDVTALFRVSVADESALDRLRDQSRVVALYAVTGGDDAVAIGKFEDTDALNAVATELLTDDAVRSLTVTVVRDVLREFEPTIPDGGPS